MAEKELVLKLRLDKSRAEQDARAFHAAESSRIDAQTAKSVAAERTKADAATRSAKERSAANTKAADEEKRAVKEVSDARTRANERGRDELGRFTAEAKASWFTTEGAIKNATGALTSFAGQMISLNTAQAVVGTVVEHFRSMRREIMESVRSLGEYRESLLELAALKDQTGDTTTTLAQEVAFRARTLQSQRDATAFQNAALGSGESALGVNISREQATRGYELAARSQSVKGGDAAVFGRMIGMMPMLMGGQNLTGEQIYAKNEQIRAILQPGSGTPGQLANHVLTNAPLVTGGIFRDIADMAALTAAFSTQNEGGAGTNVEQFTRATVGSLGRMRGANIEGLVEKQAEYLKGLGASDQMDPIQIGKLIAGDFAGQSQAAAGEGRKFDPFGYLQRHGYQNQEDIMALINFSGLMRTGQFTGTFERLANTRINAGASIEEVNRMQGADPVFAKRSAAFSQELAQIQKAAGKEETLQTMFMASHGELAGQNKITGSFDEVMNPGWFDPGAWIYNPRAEVQMKAQQRLVAEAQRVGLSPKVQFSAGPMGQGQVEQFMGEDRLYELAKQVRAAGGSITPGVNDQAAATQAQLEATKNLATAAQNLNNAVEVLRPKNTPQMARPFVQSR